MIESTNIKQGLCASISHHCSVADPEGGGGDRRAPPPPRSGFQKQKTAIFRPKYGLESVILGLRFQFFRGSMPGPLRAYESYECQLWCVGPLNPPPLSEIPGFATVAGQQSTTPNCPCYTQRRHRPNDGSITMLGHLLWLRGECELLQYLSNIYTTLSRHLNSAEQCRVRPYDYIISVFGLHVGPRAKQEGIPLTRHHAAQVSPMSSSENSFPL